MSEEFSPLLPFSVKGRINAVPSAPTYETTYGADVVPDQIISAEYVYPTSVKDSSSNRGLFVSESTIEGWKESGNVELKLMNAQIQGIRDVNNESRLLANAGTIAQAHSEDIRQQIEYTSRQDIDFTAKSEIPSLAVPINDNSNNGHSSAISEKSRATGKPNDSANSQQSSIPFIYPSPAGYQPNEYKSMYDSDTGKSGYEISEYKSIYEP